jgi:uncharacterized repeat protein (TIGR01451 family)
MKNIAIFILFFSGFVFADGTPTLELSKSVAGEATLTYTLNYDNIGEGTATDCIIYDQIPEETEYLKNSGTITVGSATIWYSDDGGANWQGNDPGTETKVIKWKFNESVPPKGTGTVKFKVKQKQK